MGWIQPQWRATADESDNYFAIVALAG
jgi:hypothetical protein